MTTETRTRHTMSDFVLHFSVRENGQEVIKTEEVGSRTMQEAVLEITRRYGADWRGWEGNSMKMIASCSGITRMY